MDAATYIHDLKNAQGLFAPERIEHLQLTPDLLEFLRDTIRPPFSEYDESDPANGYLEPLALICLTLAPSQDALEDVLQSLEAGVAEDFEWISEIAPYTLAAIGARSFDAVEARIVALEATSRADLEAETDPVYWQYVYLLDTLTQCAAKTDRKSDFLALARARLLSNTFPNSLKELWVSHFLDVHDDALLPLVESFYAAMGEGYHSFFMGTLNDYRASWLEGRPQRSNQEVALSNLEDIRQRIAEERQAQLSPEVKDAFGIPEPQTFKPNPSFFQTAAEPALPDAPAPMTFFKATGIKVGRNEPCPCGSGKKFKHCHGKNGVTHYVG
jgi:SEC-C motif